LIGGDIIVKDWVGADDSYAIVSGDIVTSHQILFGGRTDGYVATLASRFGAIGDVLTFDFATPASGTSDNAFTSIQVFKGLDESGDPIWFEIDSGPFSSTTSRRVEFTVVEPVPGLGLVGGATLALALALGIIPTLRARRARRGRAALVGAGASIGMRLPAGAG
jgi:hypothetical protein